MNGIRALRDELNTMSNPSSEACTKLHKDDKRHSLFVVASVTCAVSLTLMLGLRIRSLQHKLDDVKKHEDDCLFQPFQ